MNTLTLNKVLLNARPLNMRRRVVKDKDFIYKVLDREFTFSKTAGGKSIKSSTATIVKLKGNSVVWNQKVNYRSAYASVYGITAELLADGRVRIYGTATANVSSLHIAYCDSFIVGHKYLLTGPRGNDDKVYVHWYKASIYNSGGTSIVSPTSLKDGYGYVYIRVSSGEVVDWTGEILCHDLTQMFGAGNEPTTIEEFYARKPIVEDEYAYNEGEVIHMNTESIKSVGDNAWDEEWELGIFDNNTGAKVYDDTSIRSKNPIKVLPNETYYIYAGGLYVRMHTYDAEMNQINTSLVGETYGPTFTTPTNCAYVNFRTITAYGTTYNNDIMITLVHSGWKQDTDAGYQPYWEDRLIFDQRIKDEFPNGMKSAGTAHDEIRFNKASGKWEAVQRIGSVDMGTLSWAKSGIYTNGYYALPLSGAKPLQYPLCRLYSAVNVSSRQDKSIYVGNNGGQAQLFVIDSAYTDVASFKAAMSGVILYYELAEPTIIEYDEPFNLDYRVADFGTEQAIAETNSAPISAEIGYHILKNNLELTLNT